MIKMQLYIDPQLKKQLELNAKIKHTNLSALIREIAEQYLNDNSQKNKNPLLKYAGIIKDNIRISTDDKPESLSQEIDNIVYGKYD